MHWPSDQLINIYCSCLIFPLVTKESERQPTRSQFDPLGQSRPTGSSGQFCVTVFHGSRLVFHDSWSVFMVFHCSWSIFMVFDGSRLVFQGSWLVFMVFHGSWLVFMVFSWFQVVFLVYHGSRLVFNGSRSVLMVFHGSSFVFHGFFSWIKKH